MTDSVLRIATIGLGKIGLPLAVQYSKKGHSVFGADINQSTVDLVNKGQSPFSGEQDLDEHLRASVDSGLLRATTSTTEAVEKSDYVVVAVPVFVDRDSKPLLGAMDEATRDIGKGLQKGTLVAFETTLPVGTTRQRLTPILEEESGLVAGKDFFVVFSPERVLTGRVFADLRKYPKLVGGVDDISESRGCEFYEAVLDFDNRTDLTSPNGVWSMGSCEAAEFAKLAETTYRDVNIGLANQFALHAEKIGVDIYRVIEACNSQHFSHIHQPGVAVGGHCIPVYPHLYLQGDPAASVIISARAVNKSMPGRLLDRIEEELGTLNGQKIAILGLSYRPGVKEAAFSGTWDLVELIKKKGGAPTVNDPLYSAEELSSLGLVPYRLGESCDAAVLHTSHEEYRNISPSDLTGARVMADGRNFTSKKFRDSLKTYVLGQG